jgi:hypothetical protein
MNEYKRWQLTGVKYKADQRRKKIIKWIVIAAIIAFVVAMAFLLTSCGTGGGVSTACTPVVRIAPGAVVYPDGTAYPYSWSLPGSCLGSELK